MAHCSDIVGLHTYMVRWHLSGTIPSFVAVLMMASSARKTFHHLAVHFKYRNDTCSDIVGLHTYMVRWNLSGTIPSFVAVLILVSSARKTFHHLAVHIKNNSDMK
ncbi:hypothetical protein TNCT_671791 [Trichonephila clavata]|uniref:Uncharacterized protein n=1 Tax=Trichonephila clavata TaxID=2740835 RepID=A0A8X6L8I5_TRICU|nr:hypothetical protein TNCT_671791 [Trichonephila clavata]